MLRCLLALLVYASLVSAQPWQWQRYQGTFWHPATIGLPWIDLTGPDLGEIEYRCFGDFNGNGRDEMIVMATHVTYNHWENPQDGDFFDWTTRSQTNTMYLNGETDLFMYAINLDQDVQDELLVFSHLSQEPFTQFVRCWDPDSAIAPHFIERPDLLTAFAYPGFPAPSMFGNFDGDNSLDGFTPTESGWQRYERNGNDWTLVETLDITPSSEYTYCLVADINSDGDTEFAAYEPGIDCNCMMGTFVDYANEQAVITSGVSDLLLFPGDYDGDGTTEAFLDNYELTLPSRLVRLSAGEPFSVTELENQWTTNSPFVYSTNEGGQHRLYGIMNNWKFQIGSWTLERAAYSIQWSDTAWALNGTGTFAGRILEGNSGDIWDDDAPERVFRMDIGVDFEDIIWTVGFGSLARFYANPDTFFMHPRIGDVEGDGAGELVMNVFSGAPTGLYFYELERAGNELIAHHKPEMSAGLPTVGIIDFTLADIDNDGHAELFIGTEFWHAYFWRDGRWVDYSTTFPTGVNGNLNFADFEGDGDLDVFASNGVWISLSPTAADNVTPQPSSFSLSAYPNPFNAQTTIAFDLPKAGDVSLVLYDLVGRNVHTLLNQRMSAGAHSLNYDAADLPSGVYFARLTALELNATHKLLLLK